MTMTLVALVIVVGLIGVGAGLFFFGGNFATKRSALSTEAAVGNAFATSGSRTTAIMSRV